MSIDLKTRGLVFATFFGSCIIIGLLVAALTTEYWIESQAKVAKEEKAQGKIRFGLFSGSRSLNKGYGWRHNITDVNSLIEEDVIQYIWWLLTTIGVGLGLFCSFVSGVASVIRAASASKKRGTMIILFVSNISGLLAQLVALIAWGIQFYNSLTKNVLLAEDLRQGWHTTGLAWFSSSYFYVLAGFFVAIINIILLIAATSSASRYHRRVNTDNVDDKMQGAIMLY